jgi:glycosyltransferase involved in cell wall biosynthesis
MRRVLLVQPSMQPPGGGNGLAAWMLQGLVRQHHVTVLTWTPVDVDPINQFFGTNLRDSDFDRLLVPRAWRRSVEILPVRAALLRSALMMRHVRRVSDPFDVLINGLNEIDFGRRCIQYIHYPTYLRPRPAVDLRSYHRVPWLLNGYYALADRVADFSLERMKANLTLANSNWTAAHVHAFLGVNVRTIYPPVVGIANGFEWSRRRTAFLAIGRFSPEKEYERVMNILARVRERVPDLTFTIVGSFERHERRYYERIRAQAASLGSWVAFRDNLSRDAIATLMAETRYGIHGMREEHFGMAPAEMVRAGMIVWVPNGGGQVEIVGSEPALTYDSEEDAAGAILRVLRDEAEQRRLCQLLARRGELFDEQRFMREIQAVVAEFRE